MENREWLPAVALREAVVLPGMMIHFDLSKMQSVRAVEAAMASDQRIFLVTQKNEEIEEPEFSDLYATGCIARVCQVTRLPDNLVRVMVEGQDRGLLCGLQEEHDEYLMADVDRPETEAVQEQKSAVMTEEIRQLFARYCTVYPRAGRSLLRHLEDLTDLGQMLDQIAECIPVGYQKKQQVLDAVPVSQRYETLSVILTEEIEAAQIRSELAKQIKERVDKNQKDYILREQLQYIRKELGEDGRSEWKEYEEKLEGLKAPEQIKEQIEKHIERLKSLGGSSAEYSVEQTYIETLLEMPWSKATRDNTDLARAEEILERDHYGLTQVKERILGFLAVRALSRRADSPILCLVGPPGTGKTSIARSVAEALNRKYVRICLGGVRDEAEIRGHRRTYIGAMPGRVAAALQKVGVKNPLMLLDEVDKVSADYRGDVSSALLEVLDGEQNARFTDHYLELPLDLSQVLFVATANSAESIPRPLLDRMEVIEITGYTANEKFQIARKYLLPKQLEKCGLSDGKLTISDNALRGIIVSYTREAGVRELERKIGEICYKAAREILKGKKGPVHVTKQNLTGYLGKRRYLPLPANQENEIGIVRGLAWTSVGGETLQIEVNVMPGKGEVELTGQLGDVMKESAFTGISYIRSVASRYGISEKVFKNSDFHLHIPEGAVPKDGPSAGITMATALLSALTKTPVRADVAMTGEITLRGRVLPIGGLKEKLLAAKTAGIKTVLVPDQNRPDVEEISMEIRSGLSVIFVKTMEDVVRYAFA